MGKPYATGNEVSNTLASQYVHGIDVTIVLTSAAAFSSGGGYVRVDDGANWALLEYTGVSVNTLTGVTPCTMGVVESAASFTAAAGATVARIIAAEDLDDALDVGNANAGLLVHERGGLEADVSAYAGLVQITGGATSAKTIGISDDNIVEIDSASVATGEYAKFTANGLEGRSFAEVRSDINVADGADVTGSNAPQAHKDSHDPNDGSDALDTAAASEIAGVQAAATGTSHSLARADHAHQIQHGITDNHIVTVDQADAADNDFAKFTASGIEGRSYSEVLSDLSAQAGAAFSWNDKVLTATAGVLATAFAELTIAAGVVTVTQMLHTIDTASDDPSDDLDTINGGATVNLIVIHPAHTDRSIVVKHGTGNIWLKGQADVTLDDIRDGLILAWDGTNWFDLGSSSGGGVPDAHKDSHDPNDGSDALDTAAAAEISAVVAAGAGTSHSLARADHIHAINHAITDNHLVTVDGTPVNGEAAVFTANGLNSLSEAEFKTAFNMEAGTDFQAYDAELAALAALTFADDKIILGTGAGTIAMADCTAFAQSILDDANEAAFKATVNLEIGTDVLAQQAIGIANDNLVEIDSADAASGEYAKFTANGIESKSFAEMKGDLGYMTDLVDDTTPQLGGDLDLNDKYVELKNEPTSDVTGSGIIITATVDANATGIGAALHIAADGNYEEADASAATTVPCTGIALTAGTGASKKILLSGIIRKDAWAWTTGPGTAGLIYLSETTGALTQAAPTASGAMIQVVGYAVTDDVMFFNPQLHWIEHV